MRYLYCLRFVVLLNIVFPDYLSAQNVPFRRLVGFAPLGQPRILADSRTCLFVRAEVKQPIGSDHSVIAMDMTTGQTQVFQRVPGLLVHPEEITQAPPSLSLAKDQNGRLIRPGEQFSVEVLDVSPDGKVAVLRHLLNTGGDKFEIVKRPHGSPVPLEHRELLGLWDVSSRRLLKLLDTSEGDWVWNAKFLPNGQAICILSTVYTEKPWLDKQGPKPQIKSTTEYRLDLYSPESGKKTRTLVTRQTKGGCLVVSSESAWIMVGGGQSGKLIKEFRKEELTLYEVLTGKQVVLKDGPWLPKGSWANLNIVQNAAFTADSKYLWTDVLGWWDVATGKPIKEPWMQQITQDLLKPGNKPGIDPEKSLLSRYPVGFSPDGRCFVTSGQHTLVVLETATGNRVTNAFDIKAATKLNPKSTIANFAFSPDGTMLLTVDDDRQMIVWNLKHEKVGWPKAH